MSKLVLEPHAGYGNRYLSSEEILRDGDEYKCIDAECGCTHEWMKTSGAGIEARLAFNTDRAIYRRKVEIPAGYRRLEIGETIEPGDEYAVHYRDEWLKTGRYCFHDVARVSPADHTFRRKVVIDPGVGYRLIEISETLRAGDECKPACRPEWSWNSICNSEGDDVSRYPNWVFRRAAKSEAAQPPIGLTPRLICDGEHNAARLTDIWAAVHRFLDAGKPVPRDWVKEILDRMPLDD